MALYVSDVFRMDVINFTLYRYELPYRAFFLRREGLLLHLIHKDGEGWGEIAPLPGRSQETLDEAQEQLVSYLKDKIRHPLFPSVRFGLSSAMQPIKESSVVPLCALLTGSYDEILKRAEEALNEGFCSAKVKVSGLLLKEASSLISELAPLFCLRVDANRAFSLQEAIRLCTDTPIEYIEEPTYEIDQLEKFPFPFAVDETLLERPIPDNCHTIIYKPSILGPPATSLLLTRNKRCVLSSACETGVGIVHIAQLASHFCKETPCGLDTYRYLKSDILHTPLDFSSGMLRVPQKLHVNTSLLKKVADG